MSEAVLQAPSAVVCIIEPDPAVRDSLSEYLALLGEPVRSFASGHDWMNSLPSLTARCILCAAELPHHRGVELFEWLRQQQLRIPFALTVSSHQHALIKEAMQVGVDRILHKPMLLTNGLIDFIDAQRI